VRLGSLVGETRKREHRIAAPVLPSERRDGRTHGSLDEHVIENGDLDVLLGFTSIETRTRLFELRPQERFDAVFARAGPHRERDLSVVNGAFGRRRLVALANDLSGEQSRSCFGGVRRTDRNRRRGGRRDRLSRGNASHRGGRFRDRQRHASVAFSGRWLGAVSDLRTSRDRHVRRRFAYDVTNLQLGIDGAVTSVEQLDGELG